MAKVKVMYKILFYLLCITIALPAEAEKNAIITWDRKPLLGPEGGATDSGKVALTPLIIYWNGEKLGINENAYLNLEKKIESYKGKVIIYKLLPLSNVRDFDDPLLSNHKIRNLASLLARKNISFQLDYTGYESFNYDENNSNFKLPTLESE